MTEYQESGDRATEQGCLTEHHRQHLRDEGFSPTDIDQMQVLGVRSVTAEECKRLQIGTKTDDGTLYYPSGIYFPFTKGWGQVRCDHPPIRKGKPAKYLNTYGKGAQAYLPLGCRVITEGYKDATAGTLRGQVVTGAIAGITHVRKALQQGSRLTLLYDADIWTNPQGFAQLIHGGKWLQGKVQILPPVEGQPKAGLCEYFKAGHTAGEYQVLIQSAYRPEELLQIWPDHWQDLDSPRLFRMVRMATCLSALYLTLEEGNSFIRRFCNQYRRHGIRARELQRFAQRCRNRKNPKAFQTVYQQEYWKIHGRFSHRLRFNELTHQPELDGVAFKAEAAKAVFQIDNDFALKSCREDLMEITLKIAQVQGFHPIREYLRNVNRHTRHSQRIGTLQTLKFLGQRYLGNSDPSAQVLLRKTLIAAVARVFEPGCKVDTATVLTGPQGIGKSQFWKTLASPEWFCDDFSNPDDKDHLLKLHEAWIVEWAELHGLSKREVTRVKNFMTTARDRIRRPYGREAEWMLRPSIIVGTSNEAEFLTDPTGNRRWWIIKVMQPVDLEQLRQDRDQIWAEAVTAYQSGEPWWLMADEEQQAQVIREEFQSRDPWHDVIANYLGDRNQVSTAELLTDVLKIELSHQDYRTKRRVTDILKLCDWEPMTSAVVHQGTRQRVWRCKKNIFLSLSESGVSSVSGVSISPESIDSKDSKPTHHRHTRHTRHTRSTHQTHQPESSVSPSVSIQGQSQQGLQPIDTPDTPDTLDPLRLKTTKIYATDAGDRTEHNYSFSVGDMVIALKDFPGQQRSVSKGTRGEVVMPESGGLIRVQFGEVIKDVPAHDLGVAS